MQKSIHQNILGSLSKTTDQILIVSNRCCKNFPKKFQIAARNQMHRHEGNAILAGSYVGYVIIIGCRKNAEIYSGNCQKVAL